MSVQMAQSPKAQHTINVQQLKTSSQDLHTRWNLLKWMAHATMYGTGRPMNLSLKAHLQMQKSRHSTIQASWSNILQKKQLSTPTMIGQEHICLLANTWQHTSRQVTGKMQTRLTQHVQDTTKSLSTHKMQMKSSTLTVMICSSSH